MDRDAELRIIRTAYAKRTLAAVRVDDGSSRRAAPSAAKHARRRERPLLHGQQDPRRGSTRMRIEPRREQPGCPFGEAGPTDFDLDSQAGNAL